MKIWKRAKLSLHSNATAARIFTSIPMTYRPWRNGANHSSNHINCFRSPPLARSFLIIFAVGGYLSCFKFLVAKKFPCTLIITKWFMAKGVGGGRDRQSCSFNKASVLIKKRKEDKRSVKNEGEGEINEFRWLLLIILRDSRWTELRSTPLTLPGIYMSFKQI